MWAVRILRRDLDRILWLFDESRSRKPFAGRTETRYKPQEYAGELLDADGCIHASFGRSHRFVRTTNGATIDIEISCLVMRRLSSDELVYVQCFKGNDHKHYHFTATPYRGQSQAEPFEMVRFNNSVLLQFGSGRYQTHFRIWKCDVATGSGRSEDSPQSIIWGDADKFRFDRVIEQVDGRNVGIAEYRQKFLEVLQERLSQ